MTREAFLQMFPHASADTLRQNAELFGWGPEAPQRPKRRTLAKILTDTYVQAPIPPQTSPTSKSEALELFVPVPIRSEANQREHFRVKAKHVAEQREQVAEHLNAPLAGQSKPSLVRFVRVAKARLDDDNLAAGFKHVRDEIASLLGFDDRDPSVRWLYDQKVDRKAVPGFHLFVDWSATPCCPACGRKLVPTPGSAP